MTMHEKPRLSKMWVFGSSKVSDRLNNVIWIGMVVPRIIFSRFGDNGPGKMNGWCFFNVIEMVQFRGAMILWKWWRGMLTRDPEMNWWKNKELKTLNLGLVTYPDPKIS